MYGNVVANLITVYGHFIGGTKERKDLCQKSRYRFRSTVKPKYSKKYDTNDNYWNATLTKSQILISCTNE